MPKQPKIPHQAIVDFILSGKTTLDAKSYFGFASDNVANLRIWAAFRALGIKRPVFQEPRTCDFCRAPYIARNRKQRTCGAEECQNAVILEWQANNPEKVRMSLRDYRKSEKGRQNNLRMHRTRRSRRFGTAPDRWHFAANDIKKSLRKLKYLSVRNAWEYRIQHIQKLAKLERKFSPRKKRDVTFVPSRGHHTAASAAWQSAFRAIQTMLTQYSGRLENSAWENTVLRIQSALRTGNSLRLWKKQTEPR